LSGPRKMPRMDAAVPVDAKNAPTGPWKTAQNAVSHSAHTHRRQHALHTKNLTLPGKPATWQATASRSGAFRGESVVKNDSRFARSAVFAMSLRFASFAPFAMTPDLRARRSVR
jgi:hypothetical protein